MSRFEPPSRPHEGQGRSVHPHLPPEPPPRRQAATWLWPAALLTLSAALLCALLALLILDRGFLVGALRAAIVVLLAALVGATALGLLWLLNRARRAAVITLQHGQPVHLGDLRALTRLTAAATLERHYAAELARAERSAFPALAHYAVRHEGGPALAAPPALAGEVVEPAPSPQPLASPSSTPRG